MQTILLQDDPDLFRGMEHSLLCREGINVLLADGETALVSACSESRAQVVLLASGQSGQGLARRLEGLPHAPLCVSLPEDGQAGGMMASITDRLGLSGRQGERHSCHVPARVNAGAGSGRGRTRDLSLFGAFIATGPGCTLDGPVEVEFRPGRGGEAIHCNGQVVRGVPRDGASDHLAGLAVHFAPDGGLSRGQLENLMTAELAVSR
jgi:hypothetical protein